MMNGRVLPLGDQIVHDQIGVALVGPGGFVLAPAMLQVQHRIARRAAFFSYPGGV